MNRPGSAESDSMFADGDHTREVVVMRCGSCSDTFPADGSGPVRCPTCGSSDVDEATEPLL